MQVAEFDFPLPDEMIAQQPLADRAAARMLHLERASGASQDRMFRDLPALLRPDDLLVFNNTRVFPARLFGRRAGVRAQAVSPKNPAAREFLQGRVEVLLTKPLGNDRWETLVRPGRKIGIGERLTFGEDELHAEVIARGQHGERTLRFDAPAPDAFFAAAERLGHIPLPPYIARPDSPADRERYQTVFARERGSVAAPTAGLHFTTEILEQIRARGIETAEVTLHVGLGTFQPLHHETVEENRLHTEQFTISEAAAEKVLRARSQGRRVVAVGTTTVRTLEFAALQPGGLRAMSGEAEIFIYPGFRFQVVDTLLTNFHLPKSSLLMLVCAFAGKENVLRAYAHAVTERYRFFSYGDCMFIE
ncbi:MAG: tRNA preQ1(34) S-adenosylmethionine ribosyltransferase-isomerase QueA [Acidobacteriales bacterium]|nr:tRNA preQ1(34) S-adenosylmethionine ribosyltransferase-isomerase QueA [Terriglobales bacterium]